MTRLCYSSLCQNVCKSVMIQCCCCCCCYCCMLLCSPTDMLKKDGKGGMSSDDFVQFMEGLQSSRNIVADPSRAVSMATYSTDTISMKS